MWTTIDQFLKRDKCLENIPVLLRNMKVLGAQRPVLKEMKDHIEKEIAKQKKSGIKLTKPEIVLRLFASTGNTFF